MVNKLITKLNDLSKATQEYAERQTETWITMLSDQTVRWHHEIMITEPV